jgi:hypothetical protein
VSDQLSEKFMRHTFYLLGCERCGRFTSPPERLDLPDFADPLREPLRCNECGDTLLLAECFIADETEPWQPKPGVMWQHVAFADRLPKRNGRQIHV